MTYVGHLKVLDADSHVMELADFLDDFIDPEYSGRLKRQQMEAMARVIEEAVTKAEARADPRQKKKRWPNSA